MSTNITKLTNMSELPDAFFGMTPTEIDKCRMFNFKLMLLLIFLCIVFCCFLATMDQIYNSRGSRANTGTLIYYENFGNNETYAELISDNSLQSGISSLIVKEDVLYLNLDCNLAIINGNPFGKRSVSTYFARLVNKDDNNDVQNLGELELDSTGIYKMRFKTTEPNIIKKILSLSTIQVLFEENVILSGKFKTS